MGKVEAGLSRTEIATLGSELRRIRGRCLQKSDVLELWLRENPQADKEAARAFTSMFGKSPFPPIHGPKPENRERPFYDARFDGEWKDDEPKRWTVVTIANDDRAAWFKDYGVDLKRKNFDGGWDEKGDKPLPGVRVCIFGMYDQKYDPIAELVEPNWHTYCLKHNYALRMYPDGFHLDESRPQTYGDKGRFRCYYDLMGLFDVVMYLDIDSVFVDMETSIEGVLNHHARGPFTDVLMPEFGPRFLWTHDDGGPTSAIWIARTDATTEKHLRYAYEKAARENNVRHGKIEPNGISDQDAMTSLMHVPPFSQTFQSCIDGAKIGFVHEDSEVENPWIVTCRGGSVEQKVAALKKWSERVGAHS